MAMRAKAGWSISALSVELGMDRRTVAKRLDAAKVEPAGTVSGDPVYGLREAMAAVLSLHRESGALDPAAEKARLDAARAALAELELERRRGTLLEAEDVVATWSAHCSSARSRLRAIPKRAAVQIAGITPAMAVALGAMIDEVLHELAGGAPGAGGGKGAAKGAGRVAPARARKPRRMA